ncbi:distal membrane-arm assembly complex protein 2-like [Thalassophryne amazonica]|uniref:distal membrane-arm assembly complex protein 2-like n=1 Tax=Thalassophryne amazonica TaxID=390379 RepID=UPI0014724D86|nr:distal membrane-arm assembly complex protein 2-like [Thalassophryne amazonica]
MAASLATLQRCCQQSACILVARRSWSSSPETLQPLHKRLLLYLTQHYYDIEIFLGLGSKWKNRELRRKNMYFGYTQKFYGPDIAAAHFVLSLKGGFRYVGQPDWFRANQRGKFSWDFLNHKGTQLEEIDMSNTVITYRGLDNLENQRNLKTLSLRGCPNVDDWFLARLHMFQESLEELDISHCPNITTGGLPALNNLKTLRRLVFHLSWNTVSGLVIILLEEMLPHCQITATGYKHTVVQEDRAGVEENM